MLNYRDYVLCLALYMFVFLVSLSCNKMKPIFCFYGIRADILRIKFEKEKKKPTHCLDPFQIPNPENLTKPTQIKSNSNFLNPK